MVFKIVLAQSSGKSIGFTAKPVCPTDSGFGFCNARQGLKSKKHWSSHMEIKMEWQTLIYTVAQSVNYFFLRVFQLGLTSPKDFHLLDGVGVWVCNTRLGEVIRHPCSQAVQGKVIIFDRGGLMAFASFPGVSWGPLCWDNFKGSPMLELWTACTRNLGEPQVPD